MIIQIKPILIIIFVICLFLNPTEILACMCANLSPQDAIKRSTAVFSGKVVGFEYRKDIPNEYIVSLERQKGEKIDYETKVVKIQVERWWKGNISKEVFLITNTVRTVWSTSHNCDYNFKEGETYLIYANQENNALKNNTCMRTRKLSEAAEDLKILGKGKAQIEKKAR